MPNILKTLPNQFGQSSNNILGGASEQFGLVTNIKKISQPLEATPNF